MNFFLKIILIILVLFCFSPIESFAAKIGDLTESDLFNQALRFFTMSDPSLRYALIGSILLGVSCGILGSFIVVKKLALMGDALSHAVLPGVAAGFLWDMTRDPIAIFVGATLAGLLGAVMVGWIRETTRLKEDTALGLVLGSFFAVGVCLVSLLQRLPAGNKSGIDKFLFGQAAALGERDIVLMSIVTLFTLIIVGLLYKELLTTSFDESFARAIGLPVRLLHYGLMLLLAFSIVIALQAVGVVLVSAMLITPAAAAYLMTDRLHRLLGLAALFGVFAGAIGAFFSFLGNGLPTGPFMVLSASTIFSFAFLLSPKHGLLTRWWRQASRAARVKRENTLKAIYHVLEECDFKGEAISAKELAERRRETLEEAKDQLRNLKKVGLGNWHHDNFYLTPNGWLRACEIVRNHRLWELYLTNAAQLAVDHVHDEAEKIEHVIGEETVRQLERRLSYAKKDPHGRLIPSVEDLRQGFVGGVRLP